MLMRAHFLPRLLQSEAYTGGLIFLLGARQSREGWRVSVRPVALNACVHKCVCVCAHVFMCLHFLSGSDPSASRCWCHLLPCQSKATAECQSLRALVYRQLTCFSVLLWCTLWSSPVAVKSHKDFPTVKALFICCEQQARNLLCINRLVFFSKVLMLKISVLIDLAMSQFNLKLQIYQTLGAENALWAAILLSNDENKNIDFIKSVAI